MEMDLVEIINKQIVTNSLMVAHKFGKRHDHVMRDIRTLLKDIESLGVPKNGETPMLFMETTYTHEQNRQEYPMFLMNRDGFTLLAMGFKGKDALEWKLKYIKAFNNMEDYIKSLHDKQMHAQLESAKSKIEFCDIILDSIGTLSSSQIGADYGLSATKLNRILKEEKLIHKVNNQWILYSKYQNQGLTESKTYNLARDKVVYSYVSTRWTQKGRMKIHEILSNLGYSTDL